jgi:hypothetical protein
MCSSRGERLDPELFILWSLGHYLQGPKTFIVLLGGRLKVISVAVHAAGPHLGTRIFYSVQPPEEAGFLCSLCLSRMLRLGRFCVEAPFVILFMDQRAILCTLQFDIDF